MKRNQEENDISTPVYPKTYLRSLMSLLRQEKQLTRSMMRRTIFLGLRRLENRLERTFSIA